MGKEEDIFGSVITIIVFGNINMKKERGGILPGIILQGSVNGIYFQKSERLSVKPHECYVLLFL